VKELVREQQARKFCGGVIDERVFRHAIVGGFVVLDAKGPQAVAQRQQPVILAIVADATEDRALFPNQALVGVDPGLRKPHRPLAVGDDVDDVFADIRAGGPEHERLEVLAQHDGMIHQHRHRLRDEVHRVAVDPRNVERAGFLPAGGQLQRCRDANRIGVLALWRQTRRCSS
jgi:hypothetical protein